MRVAVLSVALSLALFALPALAVEPVNGVERPQWPTLKKYVDASNSCTAVGPR